MRPPLTALAPLAAALTWTVALTLDPGPFPTTPSVLLICTGMIISATVSIVGLVLTGGRWAHRLGWLVIAVTAVLALARPIDAIWAVSVVISTLAAVALIGLASQVRKLSSATGPPARAVLLPLTLITVPIVVGLSGTGPAWPSSVIGFGAPIAALLYTRVIFGGLVVTRVVWPGIAVALAPFLDPVGAAVSLALAAVVAVIAWGAPVKAAYHPPRQLGSTFPIPPELTPGEVLDAARIDDSGKPR